MTQLNPSIMGPGIGIFPGNGSVTVKNVTATTMQAGSIVMLDLAQTDADVTSVTPGSTAAVWGCVIFPNTVAQVRQGQFLVTLESIAAGATGKAAPTGVVPAILQLGVTNFALGEPLGVYSASGTSSQGGLQPLPTVVSNGTQGYKVVGYLMHTATIASSGGLATTLGTVWFNGMGAGFGQNAG